MPYLTNDAGDIWEFQSPDGKKVRVDPREWGWPDKRPGRHPEESRSQAEVEALPGFTITVEEGPTFEPGPRPETRNPGWLDWQDGYAPPAAAEWEQGAGTPHRLFDTLTGAFGFAADAGMRRPGLRVFRVYDFVSGKVFVVHHEDIPIKGDGIVYVLDDDYGIKIGFTAGNLPERVHQLQTGNPRTIRALASIANAGLKVEHHLHTQLAEHNFAGGEWFKRDPLVQRMEEAGGWRRFLLSLLPPGEWEITLYDQEGAAVSTAIDTSTLDR